MIFTQPQSFVEMFPIFLLFLLYISAIIHFYCDFTKEVVENVMSLPTRKAMNVAYHDLLEEKHSSIRINFTVPPTSAIKQAASPIPPKQSSSESVVSKKCESILTYPTYWIDKRCMNSSLYSFSPGIMNRTVWPVRYLSSFTAPPISPVKNTGIVFYVYSTDRCANGNRYLKELRYNLVSIRNKDSHVSSYSTLNCRPMLHSLPTVTFHSRLPSYLPSLSLYPLVIFR